MGWPVVLALLALLAAATVGCVRLAIRRWRDLLPVAGTALALARPMLLLVTGDMSRWLPGWIWSDGADGKDQIVVSSALVSLLLPLAAGGLIVFFGKRAWMRLRG